jgi:hypothetical protein
LPLSLYLKGLSQTWGPLYLRWHGQQNGEPQVFEYEPYTGVWKRFAVEFLQLFPIDSQL